MRLIKENYENLIGKEIDYGSPGYLMQGRITDINLINKNYEIIMDLFIDGRWDDGHFTVLSSNQMKELERKGEISFISPSGGYAFLSLS